MSRPKDDRPRLIVPIDAELLERLKAAADERVIGLSLLCAKLLEEGLDRLIPIAELHGIADARRRREAAALGPVRTNPTVPERRP